MYDVKCNSCGEHEENSYNIYKKKLKRTFHYKNQRHTKNNINAGNRDQKNL